jgi:hypothetical protein
LIIGLSVSAAMIILNLSPHVAASELPAYTPTKPYFINLQGDAITTVETGQQIMIMNTFANYEQNPRDYLGIVEVRDSQGITIFLAWQTSTLPTANAKTGAPGENTIGMSWSATAPGDIGCELLPLPALLMLN